MYADGLVCWGKKIYDIGAKSHKSVKIKILKCTFMQLKD